MARIRSIKPETPADETLAKACLEARLLFVYLWTLADDFGRFRANPTFLKNTLFPYDEALRAKEVDKWLSELALIKRIELYIVAGQSYGVIVNWAKHQRIDNAGKSSLPAPEEGELAASLGELPRNSANLGESPRAPDLSPLLLRKGKDRIGVEASPRKSAAPKKLTPIPENFALTEAMASYATGKGMLNVPFEFERFVNHHTSKDSRFKDWFAAWKTWVGNGIQFQSRASSRPDDWKPASKLPSAIYREGL
jgi:hypothetical protein